MGLKEEEVTCGTGMRDTCGAGARAVVLNIFHLVAHQILVLCLTVIYPLKNIVLMSVVYHFTTFVIYGKSALLLDTNSAIIISNALVSSKIDFCNSLYYKLQLFN